MQKRDSRMNLYQQPKTLLWFLLSGTTWAFYLLPLWLITTLLGHDRMNWETSLRSHYNNEIKKMSYLCFNIFFCNKNINKCTTQSRVIYELLGVIVNHGRTLIPTPTLANSAIVSVEQSKRKDGEMRARWEGVLDNSSLNNLLKIFHFLFSLKKFDR